MSPLPGGTFKLADDLTVTRVGYDAMQREPHRRCLRIIVRWRCARRRFSS
jgi:hypothetical protein